MQAILCIDSLNNLPHFCWCSFFKAARPDYSYKLPRMISVSVAPSDPPALIESPCLFDIETVVITSREYIEIEVAAYIRRQKRKRYRPACKCKSTPGIITAPMAPRLLSRNKLSSYE